MKILLTLAAVFALGASSSVSAGPIAVNAGWYGFCFAGVGSPATAGCQNDGIGTEGNSFTFTTTGPALLKVTDAFDFGDIFDVYVNSVLAFTTSAPGSGSSTSVPDVAFASGYYSAGSLALGPDTYSVDIYVNASPFSAGGAYMEVVNTSSVPEPASLSLIGVGLLGLVARRRQKMR